MKILLFVVVFLVWIGLTTAAAALTPERGETDAQPDLAHDITWLHRTPVRPASVATLAPTTTTVPATTTTTTRHTTPPPTQRAAAPRPPPTKPNTAGVEQWRSLVALYPWPVETMLAIMRCESGGNPLARNRSGASGLFQLLPGPPGWQDPATNIRLAYEMKYVPSGLAPWAASRRCWG